MQLSGSEILKQMTLLNPHNPDGKPNIVIKPFDKRCLGTNSYDLHLDNKLRVYKHTLPFGMKPIIEYDKNKKFNMIDWFDNQMAFWTYPKNPSLYDIRNPLYLIDPCKQDGYETIEIEIPENGAILSPTLGYLASTLEYTETYNLFPYIDGKSSLGRNFILNHHTAGRGDNGFCGNWTLEIRVLYPTVVYPYMRIGQIYYEEFKGTRTNYGDIKTSHYNGQRGPTPAAPVPIDLFIKDAIQKQK